MTLKFEATYLTGRAETLKLDATDIDAAMQEADSRRAFHPGCEIIVLSCRPPWIEGVTVGMAFGVASTDDAGGWSPIPAGIEKLATIIAAMTPAEQVAA